MVNLYSCSHSYLCLYQLFTCTFACAFTNLDLDWCLHLHLRKHTRTCTHTHQHTHTHTHAHAHAHAHIYRQTYTQKHRYRQSYTCMHAYTTQTHIQTDLHTDKIMGATSIIWTRCSHKVLKKKCHCAVLIQMGGLELKKMNFDELWKMNCLSKWMFGYWKQVARYAGCQCWLGCNFAHDLFSFLANWFIIRNCLIKVAGFVKVRPYVAIRLCPQKECQRFHMRRTVLHDECPRSASVLKTPSWTCQRGATSFRWLYSGKYWYSLFSRTFVQLADSWIALRKTNWEIWAVGDSHRVRC